jgi:hypothetical protein
MFYDFQLVSLYGDCIRLTGNICTLGSNTNIYIWLLFEMNLSAVLSDIVFIEFFLCNMHFVAAWVNLGRLLVVPSAVVSLCVSECVLSPHGTD